MGKFIVVCDVMIYYKAEKVNKSLLYPATQINLVNTMFRKKKKSSQERIHFGNISIYIKTQTKTTKWYFIVINS